MYPMADVAAGRTQTSTFPLDVETLPFESASEIDSHLARLEEYGRKLRSARNAMLPVARLPVEVLSLIFLHVLDHPKEPFSVPSTQKLRWASNVCRHWRAVALSCSMLWTWVEVVGVHPDWTAEMLRRSKRSTITFRAKLCNPTRRAVEASELVLAHTDRIGEIRISGDQKTVTELLASTTSYAPRLETLILENSGWRAGADVVPIGHSLLRDGMPRLKHLELRQCSVSWDAPFLRSCPDIHTLSVEGGKSSVSSQSQLLEVLESMPRLKALRLDNIICPAFLDGSSEDRTVSLPELQTITLGRSTHDVASLLTHLSFPTSTSKSLRCVCADKLDELPSLIAALHPHSSRSPSKPSIRSFHISCDAIEVSVFAKPGRRLIEDKAHWGTSEQGSTSLSLIASPEHLHTSATLTALTDAFAVTAVESLLLEDQEGLLDHATALALLARMPRLTTVHTRRDAAAYLVSALAAASVPAPRLETLVLEEADMNWGFGPLPLLHALQEAQFVRCGYGRVIDELRIRRCVNVGPRDVAVLNHLFADVEWDAFEAYASDPGESDDWPDDSEVWLEYQDFEGIHWHS